jgi:hypothetical protein
VWSAAVQGIRPDRHLDHPDFGGGVADLAPTLCALFMRRPPGEHKGGFGERLVKWYEKGLNRPWPTSA